MDSIGVNVHVGFAANTNYGNAAFPTELAKLGVRHVRDGMGAGDATNGTNPARASIGATGITKFDLIWDPRAIAQAALPATIDSTVAAVGSSFIETMEGPNEYDISGDPNALTVLPAYQAALATAVRTDSNPTIAAYPVVGYSFGNGGSVNFTQFQGQSGNWDFGNFHPYSGGAQPEASYLAGDLSGMLLINPTKPIDATEAGWYTFLDGVQGVSETAQGKYIPRLFAEFYKRGIHKAYSYEFLDLNPDPSNNNAGLHWGLVRSDFTEKPSFTALKNIISLMADPGSTFTPGSLPFVISGSTANVESIFLAKRNGRFYFLIWLNSQSFNVPGKVDITVPTQTVTLSTGGFVPNFTTINVYDPLLGATPQSTVSNAFSITLAVKDQIQIIELIP